MMMPGWRQQLLRDALKNSRDFNHFMPADVDWAYEAGLGRRAADLGHTEINPVTQIDELTSHQPGGFSEGTAYSLDLPPGRYMADPGTTHEQGMESVGLRRHTAAETEFMHYLMQRLARQNN